MTWLRRLTIMYFGVKNTLMKSMNSMLLLCIKIVGTQVNILEDKYLYLETCGNPLWIWWYELSKAIAHKITFSLSCSRASPSIPSFSSLHSELCFSTESFQQMYNTASFLQSQNSIKNEINALLSFASLYGWSPQESPYLVIFIFFSPVFFSFFSTQVSLPYTPPQLLLLSSPMTSVLSQRSNATDTWLTGIQHSCHFSLKASPVFLLTLLLLLLRLLHP